MPCRSCTRSLLGEGVTHTGAGLAAKRVELNNALKETHHKGEELGEVRCPGGQRRLQSLHVGQEIGEEELCSCRDFALC